MKNMTQQPQNLSGMVQLIGLGNSIWLKWVYTKLDGTSSEEMDKHVQVIPKQTYPVSMSMISFFLAGT